MHNTNHWPTHIAYLPLCDQFQLSKHVLVEVYPLKLPWLVGFILFEFLSRVMFAYYSVSTSKKRRIVSALFLALIWSYPVTFSAFWDGWCAPGHTRYTYLWSTVLAATVWKFIPNQVIIKMFRNALKYFTVATQRCVALSTPEVNDFFTQVEPAVFFYKETLHKTYRCSQCIEKENDVLTKRSHTQTTDSLDTYLDLVAHYKPELLTPFHISNHSNMFKKGKRTYISVCCFEIDIPYTFVSRRRYDVPLGFSRRRPAMVSNYYM